MDPITFTLLALGVTRLVIHLTRREDKVSQKDQFFIPNKLIAFVGVVNSGKTATINALTGSDNLESSPLFGSTVQFADVDFQYGYKLRDTPGILSLKDDTLSLEKMLSECEVVVYVVCQQLFREELTILEHISKSQETLNATAPHNCQRKLLLYINKIDLFEVSMIRRDREKVISKIKADVSVWIPEERVAVGSSAPLRNGVQQIPSLDNLKTCLQIHMSRRHLEN